MCSEYNEVIRRFHSLNPPYRKVGDRYLQPDLSNMRNIDEFLGNPSQRLKVIHIAGTNGKGSCANMMVAALVAAGNRVGLYQSPHHVDCRERISINGVKISKSDFCRQWFGLEDYILGRRWITDRYPNWRQPNSSEVYIGMAYSYFVARGVDVAVVEVGIGGLNDPTNIVDEPVLSVITSIGLDHTRLLGNSLQLITAEKCGIVKHGVPVVVGNVPRQVMGTIRKACDAVSSELIVSQEYSFTRGRAIAYDEKYDLRGDYQRYNVQTVATAIDYLRKARLCRIDTVDTYRVRFALQHTSQIMHFRGRWEVLVDSPKVICDVASNYLGFKNNMQQLRELRSKDCHLYFVLAFTDFTDKEHSQITKTLPKDAMYVYPFSDATMSPYKLRRLIGRRGTVVPSVHDAISFCMSKASTNDLIYIGGSVYIMHTVYAYFDKAKCLSCT